MRKLLECSFNFINGNSDLVWVRPNNIIDLSRYSKIKIEDAFKEMGFEFRKEMEGKLHYFNSDTSISIYLDPQNRKLTLVP